MGIELFNSRIGDEIGIRDLTLVTPDEPRTSDSERALTLDYINNMYKLLDMLMEPPAAPSRRATSANVDDAYAIIKQVNDARDAKKAARDQAKAEQAKAAEIRLDRTLEAGKQAINNLSPTAAKRLKRIEDRVAVFEARTAIHPNGEKSLSREEMKEYIRLKVDQNDARQKLRESIMKKVYDLSGRGDGEPLRVSGMDTATHATKLGVEAAGRLLGKLEQPLDPIVLGATDWRSHQSKDTINMHPSSQADVFIHELGHIIEHQRPDVLAMSVAYLERRCAGETPQPMNQLQPGYAYEDGEMARPDRFIDPYTGKDYGGKASEVLSMALQSLYAKPRQLYTSDPDLMAYAVGAILYLRGEVDG